MSLPDKGREYTVTWSIEVYAENAIEAVLEAERLVQDPTSTDNIFSVQPFGKPGESQEIDLEEVRSEV